MQVLLNDLRPHLPEVLGPRLQQLLRGMWCTDPAQRPDLAAVLDELTGADGTGATAFSEAVSAPPS